MSDRPPTFLTAGNFGLAALGWAVIALVVLLARAAVAQPCDVPPGATELLTSPSDPSGDSDQAGIFYGEFELELNGLPVTVQVNFTDLDHEEIIVTPPPGYWVIPDVVGHARDGESVTLLIIMGVS